MEFFSPNTIGYTLLGYLAGTFITGSTIVIVLKCVFPKGLGAVRPGANSNYRNGNSNLYRNGRGHYRKRNSFLPAALFFLLAFISFAFVTTEWGNGNGNKDQINKKQAKEEQYVSHSHQPEELRKENHSGSSTLERQENVYYASSMAVIPIGKWKNEGDAPTAEKASVPSRIYIQKAASPNRELAREEAKNWSYNLSRPVTLAFDPGSSSFPYKVLLGPYQSREDAEADKWRLQTEGFVMDISRKGWNILPVE